jgi:hypothetical protein
VSPAARTAATDEQDAPRVTMRRSRSRWGVLVGVLALGGLFLSATACTPQNDPHQAIQTWWGGDSWCANRIVQRESGFQPTAVNRSSGATGLFQLTPSHASWINSELGYSFSEMTDASKNAQAARALFNKANSYWGDGWQPWRLSSGAIRGGGCPA